MTRKEIIRMALEAGFMLSTAYGQNSGKAMPVSDSRTLEAFARMVAAAEREECAKVCDAERSKFMPSAAMNNGRESDFAFGSVNSSERIASNIRARSK